MFQRRSIRDTLLLLAAPIFAMASSVPDVVAYEPKFIYYACGHDVRTMQQCLASAERWEQEQQEQQKKDTAFADYRVVVLPGRFSSWEILSGYMSDINNIKSANRVDDFAIDVMMVDIVHIPVLHPTPRIRNECPPNLAAGTSDADGPRLLDLKDKDVVNKIKKQPYSKDFSDRVKSFLKEPDTILEGQLPAVKAGAEIGNSVYGLPYHTDIPVIYINSEQINSKCISSEPDVKCKVSDQGWQGWIHFLKDIIAIYEDSRKGVVYSVQTKRDEALIAVFFDFVFEEVKFKYENILQEYDDEVRWNKCSSNNKAKCNFIALISEVFLSKEFDDKMLSLKKIVRNNAKHEHSDVSEEDSIALFNNAVEVHTGIREEGSLSKESQVLYMRNWPFALPRINESRKRETEIRLLPGTRGGWYIAVNKDTADISGEDNEDNEIKLEKLAAIIDLMFFMSGEEEQKKRLREDGTLPTFEHLYRDGDNDDNIWEIYPAYKSLRENLKDSIQNAVERPAKIYGSAYPQVSAALADALVQFFKDNNGENDALKSFKEKALDAFNEEGRDRSKPDSNNQCQ